MGKTVVFYVNLGGISELTEVYWFPSEASTLDIERELKEWRDSKIEFTWWHEGERPTVTPAKELPEDAQIIFTSIEAREQQ